MLRWFDPMSQMRDMGLRAASLLVCDFEMYEAAARLRSA